MYLENYQQRSPLPCKRERDLVQFYDYGTDLAPIRSAAAHYFYGVLMRTNLMFFLVFLILVFVGNIQAQSNAYSHSIKPYLVSLSVSNLDSTILWYTNNVGFAVIKKMDLPKYSLRIAFLELNSFQLEIIEFKESIPFTKLKNTFPEVDDRAKVQGFTKLAFSVDSLELVVAQLKNNRITFVRDITDDADFKMRFILVEDNNGNDIQFFQKYK